MSQKGIMNRNLTKDCSLCGLVFKSKREINKHTRTHSYSFNLNVNIANLLEGKKLIWKYIQQNFMGINLNDFLNVTLISDDEKRLDAHNLNFNWCKLKVRRTIHLLKQFVWPGLQK
jgi:uncharacterized C2H2 Zn-finger protein